MELFITYWKTELLPSLQYWRPAQPLLIFVSFGTLDSIPYTYTVWLILILIYILTPFTLSHRLHYGFGPHFVAESHANSSSRPLISPSP
jgi:hypothetical protein